MRLLRPSPAIVLCLTLLGGAASTLWSLVGLSSPPAVKIYRESPQWAAERARATFARALSASEQQEDLLGEAAALTGLARIERERGNRLSAARMAERAVELIEARRDRLEDPKLRAWVLSSRREVYELAVNLLMDLAARDHSGGYDVRAFEIAERARSRGLLDDLSELNEGRMPVLTLREIQRELLDAETVLLVYFLGDERSFLWSVAPGEFTTFVLPPRDQLEGLARQVYEVLAKSNRREGRGRAERVAQRASDLFLGPVAQSLGDRRLVVIAEGALQSVPFGALPDPLDGGEPLLARHEIVVLPSPSIAAALRQLSSFRGPPAEGLIAVVADPVFSTRDERLMASRGLEQKGDLSRSSNGSERIFQRLPASRMEADAVLELAGRQRTLEAVGFDANRDLALSGRLSQFRILHFATHAVLDFAHPGQSGIVLSGFDSQGKRREGALRAEEIRNLELSADLVVLSGCETGLGPDIAGDGRATLVRSFLEAGVPQVVASLWDVEDHATAELMKRFYAGLLREGLRPAAALRKAQISMLRETPWKAPAYWAGFFIEGDWKR